MWHFTGICADRLPDDTLRNKISLQLLLAVGSKNRPFDNSYNVVIGKIHYGDVIMGQIASQITGLTIINSTVYSDADQRKHQRAASLAFVRGIHRGPVNFPHKWPVTRKMFPFDDVIMNLIMNFTDTILAELMMAECPIWFIYSTTSYNVGINVEIDAPNSLFDCVYYTPYHFNKSGKLYSRSSFQITE